MSAMILAADGGFTPPGPGVFDLPPYRRRRHQADDVLVLAAVFVGVFFVMSARRAAWCRTGCSTVGEMAYGFVRNAIARDVIGSRRLHQVRAATS